MAIFAPIILHYELGLPVTFQRVPDGVILRREPKNLEILRLTPQNDVIGQPQ
jgi:hypothetical protein